MQVSTHDQDTPAANKQHKLKISCQSISTMVEYSPLCRDYPDLSFNLVGHHAYNPSEGSTIMTSIFFLQENHKVGTKNNAKRNPLLTPKTSKLQPSLCPMH